MDGEQVNKFRNDCFLDQKAATHLFLPYFSSNAPYIQLGWCASGIQLSW